MMEKGSAVISVMVCSDCKPPALSNTSATSANRAPQNISCHLGDFSALFVAMLFIGAVNTGSLLTILAQPEYDPQIWMFGRDSTQTLISVYALSGLICAFAGWALIGRIGSVSPTSGAELNIQSITAVVIGGISLFGGRGSIWGALFGALIVGVFSLGLRLLGVDPQWTFFFIGLLIIVAVAVDQWIRKVAA